MDFELDGRAYRIVFEHKYDGLIERRITRAWLLRKDADPNVHNWWPTNLFGLAICSPKDIFTKEAGRKHSLLNLWRDVMHLDKATRAWLWEKYFSRDIQ